MAGSVATLAVLWIFLQTLGFIGNSHSVGVYKLPKTFQNDLPVYSSEFSLFSFILCFRIYFTMADVVL